MAQSHNTILADEKQVKTVEESQVSASDGETADLDWTEGEEKRLVRKIDFIVMPLLMVGFFALQMDRGNM